MNEENTMENQREETGWTTPDKSGISGKSWEDEESPYLGSPWNPEPVNEGVIRDPDFFQKKNAEPAPVQLIPPPPAPENNGMSTAALIMGILSIPATCFCTVPGILFGILGIIFSCISRRGGEMDNQAKTGLVLSIIGIVLTLIMILFIVVLVVLSDMAYSGF